ncbi:hypothetical protein BBBOND_0210770 [Babesia bigemina]|uniref:Uncharacterized protein n=1 Tax=Babesia bigemina TaxID=5866 RepID=A0A061D7G9_BABBI|nr:hypothetical protein BBBOND_0210770 [Babesia bigemina]CDR95927.1 hypothetical protein BBBOND_0210770 [Babesia bigemina]|eukprot:XP_012768113.1 hypothetical protein BBBOND_0210770 [Babesia bigemina]
MLLNTFRGRAPLLAIREARRFRRQPVKLIEKVTEEYEKAGIESTAPKPDESATERRKRMIRYVYYDPTLSQKLAIMKARFLATGWIWVVTALTTYTALNALYFANKHFEKGRYCI